MAAVVFLVAVVALGVVVMLLVFASLGASEAKRMPPKPTVVNRAVPRLRRFKTAVQKAVASSGRILVQRDRRPLWQVRGWRRVKGRLVGAYRTSRGSVAGEVKLKAQGPEFYILNPPERLLLGSHGACFRARGGGKYWIHFSQSHHDVDSGIAAIEALVATALS